MALHKHLTAIWSAILGIVFSLTTTTQDQYATIVPPAGNVPILSFEGRGVQLYQCSTSNTSDIVYQYLGAEAELFAYTIDKGSNVQYKRKWGYHYFLAHPDGEGGRPTFALHATSADNATSIPTSTATFKVVSSLAAAHPTKNIPSLLLIATSHSGNGPLSMVSYVQRVNAIGGAAPTWSCKNDNETLRVPYKAQYRFWSQGAIPPNTTPKSILVPQGYQLLASFFGQGFQIYRYDGTTWTLSNVSAVLSTLPGNPAVGKHYFSETQEGNQAQPTWEFFTPRGLVSASPIQKVQIKPTSIPWLLAHKTSSAGEECFTSKVSFVQRLSTTGGIAPQNGDSKAGDIFQSPYTAIYSFYGT